jgi:hypothetical protein
VGREGSMWEEAWGCSGMRGDNESGYVGGYESGRSLLG